jgi:hypothetical protein
VKDVNKHTEIFRFDEFDIELEDFLAGANLDMGGNVSYQDYSQIFDLSGAR